MRIFWARAPPLTMHLFDSRCAWIDECIDEKEPEKVGSSTSSPPGSLIRS